VPNPYSQELRERAVHAYESGEGTQEEIADRFSISVPSLQRWVRRSRETGSISALPRAGGWVSVVDLELLETIVHESPDSTVEELARAYNKRARRSARAHRSSILRALHRMGFVFKKNGRVRRSSFVRMSGQSAGRSRRG